MSSVSSLAASYAARGWFLVRLWGVESEAVCTCPRGGDCATPGKHPRDAAWHTRATQDEDTVMAWFEADPQANIGLLLGPRSGVVDIELDGPDAAEAWESLGLGEIYTPTYTAGRGPHRLFRWNEGLPAIAVKKINGIEVRIGNGGLAAQSVLPPSMHHTGARYSWVPGMSPDDVELAEIPERLMTLIWNESGGEAAGRKGPPTREMLHTPVGEGGRNTELRRFAIREGFRCGADLDDEREQQDLLLKLRAVNAVQCQPPLRDDEVVDIYRSAIGFVRKTRASGMPEAEAIAAAEQEPAEKKKASKKRGGEPSWVKTFTNNGLSFAPLVPDSHSDPEWGPGEWRLTVVHSDPLEYRLTVPAWRPLTPTGTGSISLTVSQYRSAALTAAAVLAGTGTVMLDDEPKKWKRIWDGGYSVTDHKDTSKPKKRSARGVKAKLLDAAEHEWPGASSLRYVHLAGWLYDRLCQASQPSDDDSPDPTGRAAWRADGTLWFGWSRVWEDIERQHRLAEGDRLALRRRLLARFEAADFRHAEFRHPGGNRKTYVVWTREEFGMLESLATSEQDGGAVIGGA